MCVNKKKIVDCFGLESGYLREWETWLLNSGEEDIQNFQLSSLL